MSEFTVKFKPGDKTVRVAGGTDLLTAAFRAGVILNSSCGGEGLCGKCKIIVKKGTVKSSSSRLISEADRKKGMVLACESIVESDAEVMVPAGSLDMQERFEKRREKAEEFPKGVITKRENVYARLPLVRKIYTEIPKPTIDDNLSDLDRIYRAVEARSAGPFVMTKLANVKHLSDLLRDSDFRVTVAVSHREGATEILAIEPGDTTAAGFAFAFDIGTTTVTGQLIDLNTGEVRGTRISYNRQARFGGDVITRIIYGSEPKGLEELNEAVLDNINEIVEELAEACSIRLTDIYAAVFAGNTTMMHLLFKVDPANIRKEPYVPTMTSFPVMSSSEAGVEINPKGNIFSLPGVSTYIGGDTVAGVLSSGLFEAKALTLLVDIGTNGEIVLGNDEWMMACAASAGPAFEGSGLTCGMKAVKGAVEKVKIGKDLGIEIETVGGGAARGICGSGYIDLLDQMLKSGIMGKDGKLNKDAAPKAVREGKAGSEFLIRAKGEDRAAGDIVVNEDDIENLKRAKGAIYSAIVTLLNKVGKTLADIEKIYIAGGFGNYIGIDCAVSIGLLPDIDRKRYEFIGNSSLAGARMSLLSQEAFSRTKEISGGITYLDLSSEPGYMDEYIAALFFPHTDIRRFPSAR
ncbi:MAG: ASKHA domain-containing protein [Candidatus Omnitrophota bacterium]